MQEAEEKGAFDYSPNTKLPSVSNANNELLENHTNEQPFTSTIPFATPATLTRNTINTEDLISLENNESNEKSPSPPSLKRKNSLDEFELEIEGINLDDNLDTSVILLISEKEM